MNKKQNSLMRFSRTERLAQLSEQEIVIERKKREIQAKLEAQKKKQTEETLRKLEFSSETKKPVFSKKSWSGSQPHKTTSNEKSAEQVKESLTNAFSNDGSFLDQFKKLSRTGLSASDTIGSSYRIQDADVGSEANAKGETTTPRLVNENSQSSLIQNQLDSRIQLQIPPPGVDLLPQDENVSRPSTVYNPVSVVPSNPVLAPQFQGGVQNPVHAFNSKNVQFNSTQSNPHGSLDQFPQLDHKLKVQGDSVPSGLIHDQFTNILSSVQPPLLVAPQNIPSPSPIQVQNIPPPPVLSSELPKLRSESISMTLKSNMVKKLEAIPNPLEVDQPPSPPSPERNHLSFTGTKESSKGFFTATSLVENVSPHNRESSRISSAFFNDDEDGEEGGDLSNEKYHHWAELVARFGDHYEESLQSRSQNDPDIRFLLNKNSKEYLLFRKLVTLYRRQPKSSEEEPSDKILKLSSSASNERSTEEIVTRKEGNCTRTKSNDEEKFEGNECSGSEITPSFDRRENETHSKYNENRDDYLQRIKSSELTSKEDCLASSQKQIFPKEQCKNEERPKRKRKSRWGDAVPTTSTPGVATNINLQPAGKLPAPKSTLLSQLTRSDPGLIQYARQTFGSTNLSEEDWKKAEDHYKINLLYQDMVKKRAEVEKLEKQGKFKYEYDSDEDTEGGTWEHKLRQQEMQATQLWAEELTRQAAGKHHIGDFLPPEELERFMEKYNAVKEGREPDLSDYKEYKLKEDNVGYRLLQKMGWNEGQGLGQDGSGITNPVNKATTRHENQGLGIERPDGLEAGDDEYDAYRKRMMLAYRFRPNPLNNPRRPYY